MGKPRQDKPIKTKKRTRQPVTLGKGEYQAKDGRYEFHYEDIHGKKCKVYSWRLLDSDVAPEGKHSEKSLRALEAEILRQLDKKIDIERAKKATLDDLFNENMEIRNVKDSTKENYTYIYETYISPVLGQKKVQDIKYSDIVKFYTGLISGTTKTKEPTKKGRKRKGFKPNSMEIVNTILHPIFDTAVKDDIILKNPTQGAMAEIKNRHDWTKPKRHALTEDQQSAFIDFVANHKQYNHWLLFFTVFLGTGLRVGELVGLTWDNCDFETNWITIDHQLVYRKRSDTGKCELHITTPKSEDGIRQIPMIEDVKTALLEEKEKPVRGFCTSVVDGVSGFIFTNRAGEVQRPHNINRAIERICDDYNEQETEKAKQEGRKPELLPHFTNHNLRHTFCTRFCENETNLKAIQEIMGHADIETTMNIYAEATKKTKQKSMASLEGKIKIR